MDRNIKVEPYDFYPCVSLSARRAWIEIRASASLRKTSMVALRKESVDRNSYRCLIVAAVEVALRKESVDRNGLQVLCKLYSAVALRKESVDRNCCHIPLTLLQITSLSARRAWIEITGTWQLSTWHAVALRKESVDRNCRPARSAWSAMVALRKESVDRNWSAYPKKTGKAESLSARRAWIEIKTRLDVVIRFFVALRKESVDRNLM